MKPWMRVAHSHPTFGKRFCNISGKMTPPTAPPVAATPVALPRLTRNQWEMLETAGVNIKLVPMPPRTPKQSMKCQYSGCQRQKRSIIVITFLRLTSADSQQLSAHNERDTATCYQKTRAFGVKVWADLHTTKERKKGIYTEDPRYLTLRIIAQLMSCQVGLVDSFA